MPLTCVVDIFRVEKKTGFTYDIILTVYTNEGSSIAFGDGTLNFGDGSSQRTPSVIPGIARPDLGENVAQVTYSTIHTFSGSGHYKITYQEPGLVAGIVNIVNSVETYFYLETGIFLQDGLDSSSPKFLVEPFFSAPVGKEYGFSAAAGDNPYTLTYELASPVEYNTKFQRPETMHVNYYNGQITWDAQFKGSSQVGVYLFAVRVSQFDEMERRIGYVTRTIQVILRDVDIGIELLNPVSDENKVILVEENQSKSLKFLMRKDTPRSNWEIALENRLTSNIDLSQYDSIIGEAEFKVGLLKLTTTSDIVQDNPYIIVLRGKVEDLEDIFVRDISLMLLTKDVELPIITRVQNESVKANVYPNPFVEYFQVESSFDLPTKLSMINDLGETVFKSQFFRRERVETVNFPRGVYFLQIETDRGIHVERIMKE